MSESFARQIHGVIHWKLNFADSQFASEISFYSELLPSNFLGIFNFILLAMLIEILYAMCIGVKLIVNSSFLFKLSQFYMQNIESFYNRQYFYAPMSSLFIT